MWGKCGCSRGSLLAGNTIGDTEGGNLSCSRLKDCRAPIVARSDGKRGGLTFLLQPVKSSCRGFDTSTCSVQRSSTGGRHTQKSRDTLCIPAVMADCNLKLIAPTVNPLFRNAGLQIRQNRKNYFCGKEQTGRMV